MRRSSRQVIVFMALMVSTLSLASLSYARDSKLADTVLDLHDGDRLLINIWHGNLHLSGPSGASSESGQLPKKNASSTSATGLSGGQAMLHASKSVSDKVFSQFESRYNGLGYTVRRTGHTVNIDFLGPSTRLEWSEWLKGSDAQEPSLDLRIEVGSSAVELPVDVTMHFGTIQLDNWKKPVNLSLIEGVVRSKGGLGALAIQLQKGEIHIDAQQGPVNIDCVECKTAVHDVDGDLFLYGHNADGTLQEIKGTSEIRTYSGNLSLAKSSGALNVHLVRSTFSATDFEGVIHGDIDQGSFMASLPAEADVRLEAQDGQVTIKLPPKSSAALHLKTEEGTISSSLEGLTAKGDRKSLVAQATGDGPGGLVNIHSAKGTIRVR